MKYNRNKLTQMNKRDTNLQNCSLPAKLRKKQQFKGLHLRAFLSFFLFSLIRMVILALKHTRHHRRTCFYVVLYKDIYSKVGLKTSTLKYKVEIISSSPIYKQVVRQNKTYAEVRLYWCGFKFFTSYFVGNELNDRPCVWSFFSWHTSIQFKMS